MALAVLAPTAAASQSPHLSTGAALSSVRVGYFHGGRTNMIYRAYISGAFEAAGLDVSLWSRDLRSKVIFKIPRDFAAALRQEKEAGSSHFARMRGIEIVDLMKSGKAEAGLIGESSYLYCLSRGDAIVAVAMLGHDHKDRPGHVVILRKGVTIRRPEDFKGLRLVSRRAGPGDEVFLREFLRSEGVDPSWVKIIDQVDDDHVDEWMKKGEIDGGYYHLLAAHRLVADGHATVYRPMNWLNAEISHALLVFRRDVVEKRPDLVERFVEAYMRRIRYERSLPKDQIVDRADIGTSMRFEFQGMSMPVYDPTPRVRPELLEEMQRLLLKHGKIDRTIALGPGIDNGFINTVARRLDAETKNPLGPE